MARVPDRYEVLETVSDTARERVVRARDRRLERDVLIKAHAPRMLGARALREARALARLDRPDVVRMIDVIDGDDGVLLVLEAVGGETLEELLAREGALSPGETARLGVALAEALAAVHGAGLVHRDVSPASVVLHPERGPCLSGFTFVKTVPAAGGSSLVFERPADASDEEAAPLPRYPAPEQWLGQGADPRADVFAAGCTLYECLAGEAPLPVTEERVDGGRRPIPPLAVAAPDAPPALRRVVERCLSQSPLKRPADGAALADALRAAEEEVAATPAASRSVTEPTTGRRAWLVTAVAAALLAAIVVLSDGMSGPDPLEPTDTRGRRLREPIRAAELAADYERSHALVIGIGEAYRSAGFPTLPNAERDGRAVAEQLTAMSWEGWDVRTLIGEEATRVAILRELDALERAADADDRVLVFYAGHGEAHERSEYGGYLIPSDARPLADDAGRSSWISFGRLQDVFHQCAAKHILLCIDSCYSGRVTTPRTGSAAARARTYLSQQAHLVLTSGRPFEQVSDGEPGRHSPFTRALLDCLTGDEPFLTTADVLVHMQDVFDEAQVPHRPSLGHATGSTFGQVVFFPRAP